MRIIDYFELPCDEQGSAREAIRRGDWRAAAFLYDMLVKGELHTHCGAHTRLLLGMEGERLACFCTLADRDEIPDADRTPWIGFVYAFPEFRGRHRAGALIEHACAIAKGEGFDRVYVSTGEIGLYEKYGFHYLGMEKDAWGGDTRIYARTL